MKTISWKITDGRQATVAISIDKNKRTFTDDWTGEQTIEDPANAWTIQYSAKVEGVGDVNFFNNPISDECPAGFAGQLGQLGFDSAIRKKIEAAIAEVEASDDWQKHLKAEA